MSLYLPTRFFIAGTNGNGNIASGAPYFYVTGISLTFNINGSTGPVETVSFNDGGTTFWIAGNLFNPNTGPPAPTYGTSGPTFTTPPNFFYKSLTAGSILGYTFSSSVAGAIITVQYGICSI